MVTKDDIRSDKATKESHGDADTSRSRRGFLKQTAAASILGMSGLSVAAKTASASKASSKTRQINGKTYTEATERTGRDEPVTDVKPMDYRGFGYIVEIEGQGPWWVNYTIDAKGDIIAAFDTETGGDDWVGVGRAGGTVYDGGVDAYYVENGVNYVGDSDGDVNFSTYPA